MQLNEMSTEALSELSIAIEAELKARQDKVIADAKEAIKAIAKEAGFDLKELIGGAAKVKQVVLAKYRNPADPSQEWSGRGRCPSWAKQYHEAGQMSSCAILR